MTFYWTDGEDICRTFSGSIGMLGTGTRSHKVRGQDLTT